MIHYPTVDDLILAATHVLRAEPEVRDWGLLASAAGRPRSTVFGKDAYPGLHEKAAALLHSLARNHALVDGNERLAWTATFAFYWINDHLLTAPSVDDGEKFVVDIAAGALELHGIATTLSDWTQPRPPVS